ncbi:unnamed protein product [Coregonus sp. 'balchen']|nr:unnamed protein product [Coregonus sp. 'balchen']
MEDLGYQGPLLDDGALEAAVSGGAPAPEFTKLCAWIVSELKLYCHLEENVHATNCPSEAEGFQLEMSGLLSELACPYKVLITGDVTQRLLNKTNCLLLINFLISELEASRMIQVNKPQKAAQEARGSVVFMELKGICVSLGMSKPPANITMFQFFSGIEKKLKEALTKVPLTHVGGPLMKKALGPVHFDKIEAINQALVNEYEVRRKMLLKRLDVTVQSFGWSDKAKKHAEKLANVYPPLRSTLATKSKVSVAHLFAAREDLSKIMRTSSGRMRERTACAINKVLMGCVPDRGGRPTEIEAPPPEMPTWQKRQDGPQGGGRGGVMGGYDQHSQGGRGGYERGGGGYERGGRGGGRGRQRGKSAGRLVGRRKRALVTLQEGIKAEEVVTNTTTTIKMVVATRTGVVEGVVGEEVIEEEVMVGEEDRGEAGEGEGVIILTKEDSLNSSSSRVASSTIKQALARGAETTLVENSAGH